MLKLDREKSIALGLFCALILASVIAPIITLKIRSDAVDMLAEKQDTLDRLAAAHRRMLGKSAATGQIGKAPAAAFLNAPTVGLASAQLESYLGKMIVAAHGTLVSSGVQPNDRSSTDSVRVQAILDIRYEALQKFFYELESGTPYVFVDLMTLHVQNRADQGTAASPLMRVTLNLRALWHQKTN